MLQSPFMVLIEVEGTKENILGIILNSGIRKCKFSRCEMHLETKNLLSAIVLDLGNVKQTILSALTSNKMCNSRSH